MNVIHLHDLLYELPSFFKAFPLRYKYFCGICLIVETKQTFKK